ncbi:hypothetical protein KIW84_065014 [Lathyrus oleraceus]|uniref:Uncharacterized protein n=1 Tax=Pisum sativum TaxID=3888 RepID=A0A9D5A912_PEA|nr:hypothetical protein KIW84_065014 [Pisum sativum]
MNQALLMVMLLGQYSTGKTTFIKHLLRCEYPGAHIGPEPTTDRFVAVMFGMDERSIPGITVAVDASMPFSGLTSFGAFTITMHLEKIELQYLATSFSLYLPAHVNRLQNNTSSPTEHNVHNCEEQEKKSDVLPSHDGPVLTVGADSNCQQFAGQEQENGIEAIAQQMNLSVDGAPCKEEINVDCGVQDPREGLHTNEPVSVQPVSLNLMPNNLDCT